MKITIFELLGMIKDGKAPYKVKYQNEIYIMDDLEYFYVNDENKTPLFESIFDNYNDYDALNEEVEIIDNLEEKKIPENLPFNNEMRLTIMEVYHELEKYNYKINEIIDYFKSKGE